MNDPTRPPNRANSPWAGQWALVTGATSGIGRAIAEELARHGAHVVLTGRRLDRLHQIAQDLGRRHGVRILSIAADLSEPEAPKTIWDFTESHGVQIDVLVNNAGLLAYGAFEASDLEVQLSMLQVHCHAALHLTRLYLGGMITRRRGQVLIVGTTSLVPAPYLSIYAATKGFLLLFGEGLREEVARHGVNVTVLCAGPTESELHMNVPASEASGGGPRLQPAAEVAQAALRGLQRRRARVHPSVLAWMLALLPRFLPRATVSGGTERMYRPPGLG